VERRRPLDDALALARSVFAPAELAALAELAEPARAARFFTTWTRKEAVIKATGLGISQALEAFSVLDDAAGAACLRGDPAVGRAEDWTLADVTVESDYPAAVALLAPDASVSPPGWLGVP
jgi:4'-phosphopantetheinyl transferase